MSATIVKSIAAGVCISIGCMVNDATGSVAGALMFSCGLYIICTQGLLLYTGRVGYMTDGIGKLLMILLGNVAGTFISSLAFYASGCEAKFDIHNIYGTGSYISLFILAFFCGVLMYAAVDGYKKTGNPLIILMCVATFILCGYKHCVAMSYRIAYMALYSWISIDDVAKFAVMVAGNSAGSIFLRVASSAKE